MNERTPDFDELVGDDLAAGERARLERVHELLLQAGPPPELPAELAEPPAPPPARVISFPRRRATWLTGVAAAATVALGFGAGYVVGDRGPAVERTIAMQGAGASASLVVFAVDEAGNWPMRLSVTGLPAGSTYELWLTKNGKLAAPCGRFTVGSDETQVPLNAPFKLKEFDGWVVVKTGQTEPLLTT